MVQLLYIVASLHIFLCPFTKVEESFNVQAIHDILYLRHNLTQYDHNEFPGVVPRSFVGPLVVSVLSSPIVFILYLLGINKFWTQYVARLTLTLIVIVTWSRLRNALQKLYGSTFAWWFMLITISQYHFMFYMSRPLPNIMVLPLVLLAFEGWLLGNLKQFIISAGAAIIIFRAELAMLFGLFLIIDLYFKKIDIKDMLKIAIPAAVGLVTLTVVVDSIFWRRLLWPEAEVFWYNTILNKSSNWGTSPFLWYIYSALPRGLGPSLLLVPVGLYLDRRLVQVVAPAVTYILLYSFLPHKELRFIIYVFPLLNMASAAVCSYVYIRRSKAPIYELLFVGTVMAVVLNAVVSVCFTAVAINNYPGGVAITRFHKLLRNEPYVNVHISNLAAQTGVTRFTQIHDHWLYNKTENLTPEDLTHFTHLIVEAKSRYSSNLKVFSQSHVVLDNVDTFSHVTVNYNFVPPVKIKTKAALFLLERRNFREYPEGHFTKQDYPFEITKDSVLEGLIEADMREPDFVIENVILSREVDGDSGIEDQDEVNNLEMAEETDTDDNEEENIAEQETQKAKKALDDLKALRRERKKKAIQKIKSETRKEVVASAKEKLKEIMKRHKHIAEELSENVLNTSPEVQEEQEQDGRGDIPETEATESSAADEVIDENVNEGIDSAETELQEEPDQTKEESDISIETINRTNENIETIVEEVIARLIDRKIYDDKTKPEDIKAEDRQMIQKIVEEVLAEKMNYSNSENK